MNEQTDFDKHATDVALARYAVIAPLVMRPLSRAEYNQELRRIRLGLHRFPGEVAVKVSPRTVHRWVHWYRHGYVTKTGVTVCGPGFEALKPTPRADIGQVRSLTTDIIDRAVKLRAQEPTRTTASLIRLIRAEYEARNQPAPPIRENTLARHLRRRGARRQDFARDGRVYPRYEHDHRNAVWQGDWTQGIALPDPTDPKRFRICHLHAFIDDHSRYVVHAEFYFRQNLPCLEDCFRKAILKGGIPERTYWDNGAVYHARQLQLLAARLGTHVIFATPYAPAGKGKIERWFQTTKKSFYPEARRAGIETLVELNTFFWGWLEEYHDRVHSEIETTPRSRWEAQADGIRVPHPSELVDLFLWEEKRRVDKAGCIQISSNSYAVAEHLVGREVTVRFDPFDLSKVRVFHNNALVEIVEPMSLVSRTFRKAKPTRGGKDVPLESAQLLRRQLSRAFQQSVEATAQQASPDNVCVTRNSLGAMLTECLGGRALTVSEANMLADFFHRYAPIVAQHARKALLAAIESKGTQRHLRFYLDAIREARLRRGEP